MISFPCDLKKNCTVFEYSNNVVLYCCTTVLLYLNIHVLNNVRIIFNNQIECTVFEHSNVYCIRIILYCTIIYRYCTVFKYVM